MSTTYFDKPVEELEKESAVEGRYLNPSKLEKETKIRFFGAGITGWQAWTTDNKPIRWEAKPEELPANLKKSDSGSVDLKHFMAGVVWDYEDKGFKILLITQKSIKDELFKYMKAPEYGPDLNSYDIKLDKAGTGLDTKYSVLPLPPKPVDKDIAKQFEELQCNLKAMYDGDDPFAD